MSRHFVARGSYDTVTVSAAYLPVAAAGTKELDLGTIVQGVDAGRPRAALVKCDSVYSSYFFANSNLSVTYSIGSLHFNQQLRLQISVSMLHEFWINY